MVEGHSGGTSVATATVEARHGTSVVMAMAAMQQRAVVAARWGAMVAAHWGRARATEGGEWCGASDVMAGEASR